MTAMQSDDRLGLAGVVWLVAEPPPIWTAPLVRDLLNGKLWKFGAPPWLGWFAAHGGPEGVLDFVAACPVPPQLQRLFRAIVDQPGMGRAYYAATMGLNPTTVSDQLTRIAVVLALYLNQWQGVALAEQQIGGAR